jgi:hypothetical protein
MTFEDLDFDFRDSSGSAEESHGGVIPGVRGSSGIVDRARHRELGQEEREVVVGC